MRWRLGLWAAFALAALAHGQAAAQTLKIGESIFEKRCKSCHEPAIDRAPTKDILRTLPPGGIIDALTSGVMQPMAAGLNAEQKQSVAAYLSGLPAKDA